MKKLIILSAIALSGLVYNSANAQVGIRVGFRFGPRRVYAAPVVVEQAPVYTDNDDDYYYLPDVDAYYSVNEQCYYYFDGDNWISAAYLPGEYRDYDWRNARRFEVREARPYLHNDVYRSRYNGNTVNAYWERHDDHFNRGYSDRSHYAYRDQNQRFNNGNRGGYDQHFGGRSQGGYIQPTRPDRGRGGSDQHYGDHGQGGYSQPAQPDRSRGSNDQHYGNGGQGGYSQPTQPERSRGSNDQRYGNGGQGGYSQPAQPNTGQGGYDRSSAQPDRSQGSSGQHSGGRGQDGNSQPVQPRGQDQGNGGGNQHRGQGSPQGGFADHRMARY